MICALETLGFSFNDFVYEMMITTKSALDLDLDMAMDGWDGASHHCWSLKLEGVGD